jgi:AAA domain
MTTAAIISPEARAAEAIRRVLETQWDGDPAVRLDSPPGAGKTGVVERLAAQSLGSMRERCMIATQTNEQAFDLARRLAENYPRLNPYLFARKDLAIPTALSAFRNLTIARSRDDLPQGPCIVISNAVKWSWVKGALPTFDLQVVDEAFQLPDYRFQQIAGLARRFVLVGDPGQIAPVVTCEIERWRCEKAGPHVACPFALTARFPQVVQLALPVSRRLVPDTVRFVQPAFYPTLPFDALAAPDSRALTLTLPLSRQPIDAALDIARGGASLISIELPPRITGEVDEELSQTIVNMIERLMARRAGLVINGERRPVEASMIGVVCAHVSQVSAVRERLPRNLSEVFVETSDRFQGLERPLMIVHHPLSGRADASGFHLDAGRLCVMMSRHSVACWLVSRGGIEAQLLRHAPVGDRVLGVDIDTEYEGWRAHLYIIQELNAASRVLQL